MSLHRFRLSLLVLAALACLRCASTGLPYEIEEEYFNLADHSEGIELRAFRLHQAHLHGQLSAAQLEEAHQLYRDAQWALDRAVTRLERAAERGHSPETSGMYLDAVRAAVTALAKFRGWSDGLVEPPGSRRGGGGNGSEVPVSSQNEAAPEASDPALASEIARHRATEQQRRAWMVNVLESLRLRRFETLGPPPAP